MSAVHQQQRIQKQKCEQQASGDKRLKIAWQETSPPVLKRCTMHNGMAHERWAGPAAAKAAEWDSRRLDEIILERG